MRKLLSSILILCIALPIQTFANSNVANALSGSVAYAPPISSSDAQKRCQNNLSRKLDTQGKSGACLDTYKYWSEFHQKREAKKNTIALPKPDTSANAKAGAAHYFNEKAKANADAASSIQTFRSDLTKWRSDLKSKVDANVKYAQDFAAKNADALPQQRDPQAEALIQEVKKKSTISSPEEKKKLLEKAQALPSKLVGEQLSAAIEGKSVLAEVDKEIEEQDRLSQKIAAEGRAAGENAADLGSNSKESAPSSSGVSGSGMLDTAGKLLPFAVAGVGIACALGKCTNQSASTGAGSDPYASASYNPYAQSPGSAAPPEPTKVSTDVEPTTIATGSKEDETAQSKVDPTTTDPSAAGSSAASSSPLENSDPSFNKAFSGDLNATNATATTSADSGAGSNSGSSRSPGSSDAGPALASLPQLGNESTYNLAGGSSGGSSSSSSLFGGSSPADNAIKDILNSEGQTEAEASLDPSLEGLMSGEDGLLQSAGIATAEDPHTLFHRVRAYHIRCLKKGCVTSGLGDKL